MRVSPHCWDARGGDPPLRGREEGQQAEESVNTLLKLSTETLTLMPELTSIISLRIMTFRGRPQCKQPRIPQLKDCSCVFIYFPVSWGSWSHSADSSCSQ